MIGTYQFLDLAPWGRNEDGLEFPQAWWRRDDDWLCISRNLKERESLRGRCAMSTLRLPD